MTTDTKAAPVILGVAAVGLMATGIYFWARKPGVQPGATMLATFKYKHRGDAGEFYFQVSLGHIRLGTIFDEVEGLQWRSMEEIDARLDWKELITKMEFELPEMMDAGEYDAEASIRTMDDELIIRHLHKSAVLVPKP